MPKSERKRVFLGVWPSDDARAALEEGVGEVKRLASRDLRVVEALRWIRPDAWHLTVVFVGAVDVTALEEITDEAAGIARAHKAFEITFGGSAGAFPGIRRPRVLWIGVQDGEGLWGRMANEMRQAISARVPLKREKEHIPHLTVARLKRGEDVGEIVEALGRVSPVTMKVSKISLIESHLTPAGAEYRTLEDFNLAD